MRFVVLGYTDPDEHASPLGGPTIGGPPSADVHRATSAGSSSVWGVLAASSAATTMRAGVLTPGPWPGTDPRLSSVCVLDARDLDAVVDLVRDLPGVVEIRPAEAR